MRSDTEYLTTSDLAQRWRLSPWTIRDYARRGLIEPVARVGREFRFPNTAKLTAPSSPARQQLADEPRARSPFDDFARALADLAER
jgi:hypothetical protein